MLRPHLSRILALASSSAGLLRSRHRPQMASARFNGSPARKARLRGVVFDMDGTLTVPAIDFGGMYREVLGEETYTALRSATPHGSIDILHHIETWAPPAQQKAYEIILRFEREGLERLQIMPGAAELCGFLDAQQVKRGLITRNVKDSVDLFHALFGMEFTPALSREFRPYKPDPAPLLHICSTWNVDPSEVMMIGDSLRDDVACGKRAGAFTCLLDETGRYDSPESFGDDLKPDFIVSSLVEVQAFKIPVIPISSLFPTIFSFFLRDASAFFTHPKHSLRSCIAQLRNAQNSRAGGTCVIVQRLLALVSGRHSRINSPGFRGEPSEITRIKN
ncbi:hypothetical protein Taro_009191 [Colocasia esculenta]|uniref:Haloacid dehalogenase-like hydrolase domain-containing protein n=1 Tax=Colocasia esculenta TaxID=4460 RepID=A0A843U0A4_COLES|nr:hypothetical protein [Colocasia esculenta]